MERKVFVNADRRHEDAALPQRDLLCRKELMQETALDTCFGFDRFS
jgi:hypothetical protein